MIYFYILYEDTVDAKFVVSNQQTASKQLKDQEEYVGVFLWNSFFVDQFEGSRRDQLDCREASAVSLQAIDHSSGWPLSLIAPDLEATASLSNFRASVRLSSLTRNTVRFQFSRRLFHRRRRSNVNQLYPTISREQSFCRLIGVRPQNGSDCYTFIPSRVLRWQQELANTKAWSLKYYYYPQTLK